jgi:sodium-coupled neutral amino acid transporter 11
MAPYTTNPKSPFFAPSKAPPSKSSSSLHHDGVEKEERGQVLHRTTIAGAIANQINAVIGAGIVGIPYALQQTGLLAGILLLLTCALMTEKSLRLLVITAKHVNVATYERLFESTYGSMGFYFITTNMIIMAYGGCLTYLMIIRDTLPVLLGVDVDDVTMQRLVLLGSTILVLLPISMQRVSFVYCCCIIILVCAVCLSFFLFFIQLFLVVCSHFLQFLTIILCTQDMAALAKFSKFAVLSQASMVLLIVLFAPWKTTLAKHHGLPHMISTGIVPLVNISTVFIGLGVLGFAFVCQHSAFLNAASLDHPTRDRWGKVTRRALLICLLLESSCGIFGYLAFLDKTEGNVLNNFLNLQHDPMAHMAGQVGRILICATMFVVYPVDSFVLRHICVVFFFRGRKAQEGDAESVLERWDRRVGTTVAIYIITLVPALLTKNVGNVLAISGTIGASCLAYIGPGLIYMAVYGEEFLVLVDETWGVRGGGGGVSSSTTTADADSLESSSLLANIASPKPETMCEKFIKDVLWYILLMPLWCIIADRGQKRLDFFRMKESMKSPHMSRIASEQQVNIAASTSSKHQRNVDGDDDEEDGGPSSTMRGSLSYNDLGVGNIGNNYGSTTNDKTQSTSTSTIAKEVMVSDVEIPTWSDFIVAIFFIAFGLVALSAGMVSIFLK